MNNSGMISTEAWVLHKGPAEGGKGELKLETFTFANPNDDEVLVEPLYGCWEANMTHAVERRPVDIARQRNEDRVVIGNAGVVRIVAKGANVKTCEVGDTCIVFCVGQIDKYGYPVKIMAYDSPGTMGVLAKTAKMPGHSVIPIPKNSKYSLQQWAAFSLRYVTAWSNYKIAFNCWKTQVEGFNTSDEYFLAWGGGVSYAEAQLALHDGFNVAMIASQTERLEALKAEGITPIDRREFADMRFDPVKYSKDPEFKAKYTAAENKFLQLIDDFTKGQGVAILVDYIGLPVYRASIKALGRQGVITTAGWKDGMVLTNYRAIECISRHIHVHTHYANYRQGVEAVAYGEAKGWMPVVVSAEEYSYTDIPKLNEDFAEGRVQSYFPIFKVNS